MPISLSTINFVSLLGLLALNDIIILEKLLTTSISALQSISATTHSHHSATPGNFMQKGTLIYKRFAECASCLSLERFILICKEIGIFYDFKRDRIEFVKPNKLRNQCISVISHF